MTVRQLLLCVSLAALAAPASAQFSDSYNFLKAVRDQDGAKATELLNKGGPNLINTPDMTTGERPLHLAVKSRAISWVGFLLTKNARVDLKDNQGNTALMTAANIGFVDAARVLLMRGAQVNATNSLGQTPLMLAVQRRDSDMVRLLLTNGADPARKDIAAGLSARDYAVRDGRSEAIIRLMDEVKPQPQKGIAGPK